MQQRMCWNEWLEILISIELNAIMSITRQLLISGDLHYHICSSVFTEHNCSNISKHVNLSYLYFCYLIDTNHLVVISLIDTVPSKANILKQYVHFPTITIVYLIDGKKTLYTSHLDWGIY